MMDGHIPPGFEMLVNNFSVGIIGMILCLLAMLGVTPLVNGLTAMMSSGVGFLVEHSLLPLTSVFIEPAKVLFLAETDSSVCMENKFHVCRPKNG